MIHLVAIEGAATGAKFALVEGENILGRSHQLAVTLAGTDVSRRHTRILLRQGEALIEDLGSSNGTFVNGRRVQGQALLRARDVVKIGAHVFRVETDQPADPAMTINWSTLADVANPDLFRENPARKLQIVLDFARLLVRATDAEAVHLCLIEQLLLLFPQASRGLVIAPRGDSFEVKASQSRGSAGSVGAAFSRSVVAQVMSSGLAVLAEDAAKLDLSQTINTLGIRSLICVPLRGQGGRTLGVIQLDRLQRGAPFTHEDLNLVTAISLQAAASLENTILQQEMLAAQRLKADLALAREVQHGLLPVETPVLSAGPLDLCGGLQPAQEIAGDFYDYFALDDRRVALVVADVSGKGVQTSLHMGMVRALARHFLETEPSPARVLFRLNNAVARNNPKFMFVTLALAVYDVASGRCEIARAGHPAPLFRNHRGEISEVAVPPGPLLGIDPDCAYPEETRITLEPGDTLLLFSDGVTEAYGQEEQDLFGLERLMGVFGQLPVQGVLRDWLRLIGDEIRAFSQTDTLRDDVTLLALRRM